MLYLDIQNLCSFLNKGQDFIVREKNEDGSYRPIINGAQYVLYSIPNQSGTLLLTAGVRVKL